MGEGSDQQNTFDTQFIFMAKETVLYLSEHTMVTMKYEPLRIHLFFPGQTGWNRWMPCHVPSSVVPPFIDKENNKDGIVGEDLQVPYHTSNAHVEQKRR
jgi:hypothetical protein